MTDHPTLTPWGLSLLPEYRGADRPVPDPGHASRPHYEAERDALRARDRELTMVLRYLAMCTASTVYGLGSWALSHCIDRYALRHGWTADATRPQPLDISNGIVLAAVLMSGWEVLPRGRGWLDLPDAPNRLIMLANNFDERRSAYTPAAPAPVRRPQATPHIAWRAQPPGGREPRRLP